jgi:hypothetical protein
MSAGAFDRLLYTDCRAGSGRGGGGGFQVQAQSAGVDAAQAKMAVGWLLYEAPNAWIVQRRPVPDFPLGFAHASGAGYGTAQSCYVGTEATGARQGNHLADCLLTRDLDLYGPTRPAQLWRSSLWRSSAWETTECPQLVDAPLGSLTVDAVADWLRASADRSVVLARLLSILEDPAGRRVIIAAAGPDEALLWIAAATLLLPVRVALDVSFKVFCSNPQRAGQRIVAVLKELSPQIVPGRADSAFVLDAEGCASDQAEVTERARFWVRLLASAEDPYDVVDAVELADQLGGGTSQDRPDAMMTAWAVTAPGDPLDDPAALFRWLSGADPRLQLEHGPSVVRRILAASPAATALRWIDAAAATGHLDTDRPAVRAQLLTAEIAEIRAGGRPPAEPLAAVNGDAGTRRDADSELSSAMVLSPHPQVGLLLTLARRHGVQPELPPLVSRLREFAIDWVDHPSRDYRPPQWALREQVLDLAHAELQERLAREGLPAVKGALKRLCPYLAARPGDLADPLDCHIQIAALRALPAEKRAPRLSALTEQAQLSHWPADAIAAIQRALVEWQAIGPVEALVILRVLPDTVPVAEEVISAALDEIQRTADRPSAGMLDALGVLDHRRLAPPVQPFAGLAEADRHVLDFVDATRSDTFRTDVKWARDWVRSLGGVEPGVARARLRLLLGACLEFPDPGFGAAVLGVLPDPLPRQIVSLWARELRGPRSVRAAVHGVCWAGDQKTAALSPHIADKFREHSAALSEADQEEWYLSVRRELNPDQVWKWAELNGQEAARPRRGLFSRARDE